jgi:hypothetical protein
LSGLLPDETRWLLVPRRHTPTDGALTAQDPWFPVDAQRGAAQTERIILRKSSAREANAAERPRPEFTKCAGRA